VINTLLSLGMLFFICVFSSCTTIEKQPLDYEQIADQITAKTGKQLKKEKGLALVGTGGRMMNDIQMMAMSFYLYHEVSLEEARELVVHIGGKYLKNINECEEIRPHLHDNPFTAKNIEIRIWASNPDRTNLPPDKIFCFTINKGLVSYFTRKLSYYNPLLEETYEEALEIVSNKKSPLPKAS
jgi:hypothetical protein